MTDTRTDPHVWRRVAERCATSAVIAMKSGVIPEAEAWVLGRQVAQACYDTESEAGADGLGDGSEPHGAATGTCGAAIDGVARGAGSEEG